MSPGQADQIPWAGEPVVAGMGEPGDGRAGPAERQPRLILTRDPRPTRRNGKVQKAARPDHGRRRHRPHVNAVIQVMKDLGMDIPVCGMVKDDSTGLRGSRSLKGNDSLKPLSY